MALELLQRSVQRVSSVHINIRLDSNPLNPAILDRIVICDGQAPVEAARLGARSCAAFQRRETKLPPSTGSCSKCATSGRTAKAPPPFCRRSISSASAPLFAMATYDASISAKPSMHSS